ncbi:hypothetical protein BZG36_03046 [Bifiguratus adelaidae]|uniref:Survival protein SurE-like phosphatase/nucleotidase domain-containing protein n=1 Tax=Bifiguratus adelaidae TaxID=1938954 RepID=A0A261XZ34_9FUNG|nr:hypothetical protein BZG36_03046 [Bifiguratus adelaidae]
MAIDEGQGLRVLITNDDGPPSAESPFIAQFVDSLKAIGWKPHVVLPDSQKSWISKSFMINDEIKVSYYDAQNKTISIERHHEDDWTLLSGTPSTCVNIALHHIHPDQDFDLVIAGPNFGRNSSTIYTLASGTIGAAMDAALCAKKAIALSFAFYDKDLHPDKIRNSCDMAIQVIQKLWMEDKWPANGLFNINVPLVTEACPVHMTTVHRNSYGSLFKPIGHPQQPSDRAAENAPSNFAQPTDQSTNRPSSSTEPIQRFVFAPDFKSLVASTAPPGTDAWAVANRYISGKRVVVVFCTHPIFMLFISDAAQSIL